MIPRLYVSLFCIIGALTRENLTLLQANKKGADQPEHVCSLISTLVIRSLNSVIAKQAMCKVSVIQLVSVAEHIDWSLT